MPVRLLRTALAAVLVVGLTVPADADEAPAPSFPPVADGKWEGLLEVSGWIASDGENDDGSFTTSETDIIDDTVISFDLQVDDSGEVTAGTMRVDLTWFVEIVGTAPVTFDPYRVVHDQHQTGTLALSGNAGRLVASGTLTHETNTMADGTEVPEVSGTEEQAVEWVFAATEANCARVSGGLIAADGISVMRSVLVPRDVYSSSGETHNTLVARFIAWPASVEDPEAITRYLNEVKQAATELRDRDLPEPADLLALLRPWQDLAAELASLDQCQTELVGWQPEFKQPWLVKELQDAMTKALDDADLYTTSELIYLWDIGVEASALDSALIIRFLDALHAKLNEAIANDDTGDILEILAFASQYGYPNLHDKAQQAWDAP